MKNAVLDHYRLGNLLGCCELLLAINGNLYRDRERWTAVRDALLEAGIDNEDMTDDLADALDDEYPLN